MPRSCEDFFFRCKCLKNSLYVEGIFSRNASQISMSRNLKATSEKATSGGKAASIRNANTCLNSISFPMLSALCSPGFYTSFSRTGVWKVKWTAQEGYMCFSPVGAKGHKPMNRLKFNFNWNWNFNVRWRQFVKYCSMLHIIHSLQFSILIIHKTRSSTQH